MKHFIHVNDLRPTRILWLAAAFGAAGALAVGSSAAAPTSYGPPYPQTVKAPQLKHGVLTIKGTKAADKIAVRLAAGDSRTLQVDTNDDGTSDFSFARADVTRIIVRAGAGNDAVRMDESNGVFTDTIPTTIDGGTGNDRIAGGKGNERLLGGPGNDSIDGNGGDDVALLGTGSDTFVWDPGDGSDTIEGGAGADTMLFNGAAASEQVDLSTSGHRLKFFRNPGNVTMDTAGVERVDFNALGGADVVTVNDLTGTGVRVVHVDLAGTLGGVAGDGQADRVIVNGTNRRDAIDVSGDSNVVKVSGLAATTEILHSEFTNDRLDVNTLAGTDTVGSAGLAAGAIRLFLDGVLVS
jgi:Ca2+-binding RTX toxin-like protein